MKILSHSSPFAKNTPSQNSSRPKTNLANSHKFNITFIKKCQLKCDDQLNLSYLQTKKEKEDFQNSISNINRQNMSLTHRMQ